MYENLLPLTSLAEQALTARFSLPIRLEPLAQLESQPLVVRYRVHAGDGNAPASVILKQVNDASKAQFAPRTLFLNEWASLEFLSGLTAACSPQLYASHRPEQFVLLEDLGECPSVQEILFGDNPARAHAALLAWGTLLGRMQRATLGHEPQFLALQTELGTITVLSDSNFDLRVELPTLRECLQTLEISIPTGFDAAIAALAQAMCDASPFRTFAHLDAGPHNGLMTPHGLRLLDFEMAGFGNALVDVVGARMAFPAAYRGRRVPMLSVKALEARYRAEIVEAIPELAEDRVFERLLGQACAHWAFVRVWGFWRGYLKNRLDIGPDYETQHGIKPENTAYYRTMIFTYLRAFIETAETLGQQPLLRATAEQVLDALLRAWPELEPWPVYPAFGI
jgi:hypothetical protein